MSNLMVSVVINGVAQEFTPGDWARICAGEMDADMPILRHVIYEQSLLLQLARMTVSELEQELRTAEALAVESLKRGNPRGKKV